MGDALDLSFVATKDDFEKPVASGSLDLSFADSPKLTAAQTAQDIVARQDAGGFPQGSREDDAGFMASVGRFMSGNDRETNATKNLPELGSQISLMDFMGTDKSSLDANLSGFKTSAAALLTMNPVESVKILSEAAGGKLEVRPDEAGNIILSLDGREAILNKPGMSPVDWMQLGGIGAVFAPAATAVGPTIGASMLGVGVSSGLTQTGIELLQSSEGGDVNGGDIAMAGVASAGFQGLLQKLAQSWAPALRQKIKDSGITRTIREQFVKVAISAGYQADDVTDDMIRSAINTTDQPITTTEQLAIQGEREFGIPLTKGQRSLNQQQLSVEDSLTVGSRGGSGQEKMLNFKNGQQIPAVNRARDAVDDMAGNVPGRPGSIIRDGVKAAEETELAIYHAALDEVGEASLKPEGLRGMFKAIRRSVREMEFDKTLPKTAQALSEIDDYMRAIKVFEGKGLKDTSLKHLDQMNRRINTLIKAAEPADGRQLLIMKRAMDRYTDDAVEAALFSGDQEALAALKETRSVFASYAKKFRPQPVKGKSGRTVDHDPAGKFVERIISANPTDEEIINSVFGASGINAKAGAAMATRYREILGPDSAGWQAIRKEAVKRLFQTSKFNSVDMVSGSKSLTAFDKAMENSGTLMREMFTPDELSYIKRLMVHIKRTQPDHVVSGENRSGTAQKAAKEMTALMSRMGLMLSFSGEPMMAATGAGIKLGSGARNSGRAAAAIKPFELPYRVKSGAVAASVGATEAVSD